MADLKYRDRVKIEKLLEMGNGYVLDFSNKTFREFIQNTVGCTKHCRFFFLCSLSNKLVYLLPLSTKIFSSQIYYLLCAFYCPPLSRTL